MIVDMRSKHLRSSWRKRDEDFGVSLGAMHLGEVFLITQDSGCVLTTLSGCVGTTSFGTKASSSIQMAKARRLAGTFCSVNVFEQSDRGRRGRLAGAHTQQNGYLAVAFEALYFRNDDSRLKAYSQTCLERIWKTQRFRPG